MKRIVSVIGPSESSPNLNNIAYKIGEFLAENNFIVATGGKSGIMEWTLKGAKGKGGLTLGILPESSKKFANPFVEIAIPTGLGVARNFVLVNIADCVITIGISSGTLIELAYAVKTEKLVFFYGFSQIPGLNYAKVIEFKTLKSFKDVFKRHCLDFETKTPENFRKF